MAPASEGTEPVTGQTRDAAAGGPILPAVTAVDAPIPAMRSLEDAQALLAEIEQGALDILAKHGLPVNTGLYRRQKPDGDWRRMDAAASSQSRWAEILDRPPEAGFQYSSLADVARAERPDAADIQIAATTLDRVADLGRLLGETDGEDDHSALLMFWSTVELMAVLFSGNRRRSDSRQAGRRLVEWQAWRAEAGRIWSTDPGLSLRAVARLVVTRLDLVESHHSVRRRLSGYQPASSFPD